MKIYLAAKYSRMEELRGYRDQLIALGHTVTSRWLDGNHEQSDESDPTNVDLQRWAREDIEDILSADVFVCFTGGEKSTGRNIEFGYALGRGIPVRVVGPRESVFHHIPFVSVFESWRDYLELVVNG